MKNGNAVSQIWRSYLSYLLKRDKTGFWCKRYSQGWGREKGFFNHLRLMLLLSLLISPHYFIMRRYRWQEKTFGWVLVKCPPVKRLGSLIKQQRQRQLRKRHLKKAVPLLQISSRLSLSSADVGNFFCSSILRDCIEVQEKKNKVVVLCSRPPRNSAFSCRNHAGTAKKCTKMRDPRAKLLFLPI